MQEVIQDESKILQNQKVFTGCYCGQYNYNSIYQSYVPQGQSICDNYGTMQICTAGCGQEGGTACVSSSCNAGEKVFGYAMDPILEGMSVCDKNGQTHYCNPGGNLFFVGQSCTNGLSCAGGTDINGFSLPPLPSGMQVCYSNAYNYVCDLNGNFQVMYQTSCGPTYCEPFHHNGTNTTHEPVPSGQTVCGSNHKTYFCDIDTHWRDLNIPCNQTFCVGGETFNGKTVDRVANGRSICSLDGTTYFCNWQGNLIHTGFKCKG